MKINIWIVLAIVIMLILAMSCGDEESKFPTEPQSASGITNASGEVQLDLGSHIVTIETVNENGSAVSNMNVSAYLLQNFLSVYASGDDSYYPGFTYIPYGSLPGTEETYYAPRPATPQTPEGIMTVETSFELTLHSIDRDIYSFSDEPLENEDVYNDDWIDKVSRTGTLQEVYNLADTISWEGGIFIRISNGVASLTNAEVQTVSLPLGRIADFPTFAVLLGLEFHIFDEDTLTFNTITFDSENLPVIEIDEITMVEGSFFAQFTLTWDENPSDLDSHLWTPEIEDSSYHIVYYSKGDADVAPYAFLDVDDVTSYGPEHIAIYQAFSGDYTYAVKHYSGSSDIPNSGAEVSLLKPDRSVLKFTPPDTTAQTGYFWHVCKIDGASGTVTTINIISPNPPFPDVMVNRAPEKNY